MSSYRYEITPVHGVPGRVNVRAWLGQRLVHSDGADLSSAADRSRVAAALSALTGDPVEDLERMELDGLQNTLLAGKRAGGPNGNHSGPPDDASGSAATTRTGEATRRPVERFRAGQLLARYPELKPPVIEGLFREREVINLVSLSKYGKTWLVDALALNIVTGRPWLNRFPTSRGRVLIIDNELHRETIAERIRIVADAMGIPLADYADDLEIWPLRGNLRDIFEIGDELAMITPGTFKAIFFDAKYRMMPLGAGENDNAAETHFYNRLDVYAELTEASIFNVHHASKGTQSDKRVTDVGAGAGAQSRAADTHLVLREHEEENVAVLEAAVRSFPPVAPLAVRWNFPLWEPDGSSDPAKLKGRQSAQERRQRERDQEAINVIIGALKERPLTRRKLRDVTGYGDERLGRLLGILAADGRVNAGEELVSGNDCTVYRPADC